MSAKYCLPVPVFHFWPKLTHPAARSLCDSWASFFRFVTNQAFDRPTAFSWLHRALHYMQSQSHGKYVTFRYFISWWVSCSINRHIQSSIYDNHRNEMHSVTLGNYWNSFAAGAPPDPLTELMTLRRLSSQLEGETPSPLSIFLDVFGSRPPFSLPPSPRPFLLDPPCSQSRPTTVNTLTSRRLPALVLIATRVSSTDNSLFFSNSSI